MMHWKARESSLPIVSGLIEHVKVRECCVAEEEEEAVTGSAVPKHTGDSMFAVAAANRP